ncbi:S49 family peptidase [Rhizobium sp. RU36D]|uniref:S49 family peptidase n=1 Tax=Rhizobium sp. RU36D TaxID=1907415 RepID=UPI0009D7DF13|nr:S49 family peptidase [Rhizobium sp. RU36D]SMD18164.1 signal peptide peptidase SppA [Rhizobium sp. RU36D]
MSVLLHIADRALNRPLLITPEKAQVIMSVLAARIGLNGPEASRFEGDNIERDEQGNIVRTINRWGESVAKTKPYNVKDGVGIITITGSLVNRGAWVGANSGLTSYEGISHQIKTAAADDAVHSVILDLHSPGGEATGAFEVAALTRSLSAKKRTVAIVNGQSCSACYAIACGSSEIITTETGVSGSIGVVMLHADYSKMLAKEGVTPTLIFAGAHKVDANPFEPLPADVRDQLQSEVTAFYEQFLITVAKGRGSRLGVEAARATEAKTFIGQAAVNAGIADRLGTFEDVLAELIKPAARGNQLVTKRKTAMENSGTPAADGGGISKAEHDAAVKAATDTGRAEGAKLATDRLCAALSAEGIKGDSARMSAALDLAVKSPSMSGEDVAAFVAGNVASAQPSQAAPASYEASRMAGAGLAAPGAEKPTKSGLSARIDAQIASIKKGA